MNLEIRFHKTFLKELAGIPLKERKKIKHFLFEESPGFRDLNEISDLKKLKGYTHYYRLRFCNYRAGIQ